ncbi:NAD-dependent epimerase/dehydratase family protein [Chloroflexota bacterium]
MKVLVVGGAGYIGGAVTDLLLQSQHHVRVFDALLYEEAYRKPVDFIYGNVLDYEQLQPHLAWADVVVWLAAIVGDAACALSPDVSIAINQDSVKWLTENFENRIIFLSTCSVYGAGDGILDESSSTNPLSVYAVTKLEAERYLIDKKALIFRLGTLFGMGDLFSRIRLDLVVNTLTVRAHQFGKITVYGGNQFRPLLHVRDVAQAIVDNLSTDHTGVFNLHQENIRIVDLAHQMSNHFPDLLIEQTERQFEDARNYRVSSDKAKTALEFNPRFSIDEGIGELKVFFESGRLRDMDNPRYTNQKFLSVANTHFRG